jgi:excisionase family DNA binding protein
MEVLLVSITEAAKALNLGRTSVYKLMDEGRLESRKMGRRRLITTTSIRRLVELEV